MHPIATEDIATDDARPLRHALRDLAASVLVVGAIALIVNLLAARS